jgi:outer membrane lipoprotein-sorting protein
MSKLVGTVFGAMVMVTLALATNARAQTTETVTIEFSTQYPNPFRRDFAQEQGIIFTNGDAVGLVQGGTT